MKLEEKRVIADKVLASLKRNNVATCVDSSLMVNKVSEDINEPNWNIWKAIELLRIMGRVELNNPNGRKGFRVVDYSPISTGVPDRPKVAVPICSMEIAIKEAERERILGIFKDYDELSERAFLKKYPKVPREVYVDGGEFYLVMSYATKENE